MYRNMGFIQTPMALIVPRFVYEPFVENFGEQILTAALSGDRLMLRFGIGSGGNPDYIHPATGLTPLRAAAQNGYFEIVKDLVEMAHVFPCPYAACAAQKRGHKAHCRVLVELRESLGPPVVILLCDWRISRVA
jgi:hypothetical protein